MGFLSGLFGSGGSSTSTSSPVRMPRTKEGQMLLDLLMESLAVEKIPAMSEQYKTSQRGYISGLGDLAGQISKPAYNLKVGKMSMPIAPLGAIKTQAGLIGGQADLEQKLFDTYIGKLFEAATKMESERVGQQTTTTQEGASSGLLGSIAPILSGLAGIGAAGGFSKIFS